MKDRKTYKILTIVSLILPFPINRVYLGEKISIWRWLTLNYCFVGGFMDLFYMDQRFDEMMAKRGFVNTTARNNEKK